MDERGYPLVTTDTITLRGIRARGFHGVFAEERREGQTFVVDVTLAVDLGPAAAADDLSLTVDYGRVAAAIVDEITGQPCDLIETLATRIAGRLLAHGRVHTVEVTVHKPDAPVGVPFDDVTVTVRRGRE